MPAYNPKELFQKDETRARKWAAVAGSSAFHEVLAFAQAQQVHKGRGPDFLAGVNDFIHTLTNLSEPEQMPKPMPSRPLKSFDNPPPTTTVTPI